MEAEKKHMVFDTRLGKKGVPFGFMNTEWKRLISQMAESDELWEFSSPAKTWENLCGRQGIALVRDGEIIDFIVTRMN